MVMMIKLKKLIGDITGGTFLAMVAGAILAFITFFFVYIFNRYSFFGRPENQHWTVYTEPVYLDQMFKVNAMQDPVILFAFLIPFVVLIGTLIWYVKQGSYTE